MKSWSLTLRFRWGFRYGLTAHAARAATQGKRKFQRKTPAIINRNANAGTAVSFTPCKQTFEQAHGSQGKNGHLSPSCGHPDSPSPSPRYSSSNCASSHCYINPPPHHSPAARSSLFPQQGLRFIPQTQQKLLVGKVAEIHLVCDLGLVSKEIHFAASGALDGVGHGEALDGRDLCPAVCLQRARQCLGHARQAFWLDDAERGLGACARRILGASCSGWEGES